MGELVVDTQEIPVPELYTTLDERAAALRALGERCRLSLEKYLLDQMFPPGYMYVPRPPPTKLQTLRRKLDASYWRVHVWLEGLGHYIKHGECGRCENDN